LIDAILIVSLYAYDTEGAAVTCKVDFNGQEVSASGKVIVRSNFAEKVSFLFIFIFSLNPTNMEGPPVKSGTSWWRKQKNWIETTFFHHQLFF
jgi:hypothetical protein